MARLIRSSLLLSSLLFCCATLSAQSPALLFPKNNGDKLRAEAVINIGEAYVSGLCLMKNTDGVINAAIINEFGISAIHFTYNLRTTKVKLVDIVSMLNKWYIRKVLKRDISQWMQTLLAGETQYINQKRKITYTLHETAE